MSCPTCGAEPPKGRRYCNQQCYRSRPPLPPQPGYEKKPLTDAERERFWSHVKKTGGCWLWTGATDGAGYGLFKLRGKMVRAVRLAWADEHGLLPSGTMACHRCDNPPCVRASCSVPGCDHGQYAKECESHIFPSTAIGNAQDREEKGRHKGGRKRVNPPRAPLYRKDSIRGKGHWRHRHPDWVPRGEASATAKLTEAKVIAIHERYANGETNKAFLAREYGVSAPLIAKVLRGDAWAHLHPSRRARQE